MLIITKPDDLKNIYKLTAIKKICDIYDWHGKGQLDLFYLGDVIYALGFNITKKICMANGQQEEEAKKFASFDEVVTMVNAALKTPENHGNYHDYIELCKLYDKNENGTMMLAELENILSNLGKIKHFYAWANISCSHSENKDNKDNI